LCGIALGLSLPFAPVFGEETTLTWPRSGDAVRSTTVTVVPYRPDTLTVTLPCSVLRSAIPTTVFTTANDGGLVVRSGPDGATLQLDETTIPLAVDAGLACRTTVSAGPQGVAITAPDGIVTLLPESPVPKVFGFRTDLRADQARGMEATATVATPFGTSPTGLKAILIGLHLLAVALALALLPRARRRPRHLTVRLWWIDALVIAALMLWAVIGPLAVDDGWASVIARNIAATGDPGNYFRWWNAAEVPFALSQQLLAPMTDVSLAPLWLRLPSTVLAVATWLVLSRGVLQAALPRGCNTTWVRLLAAVFLLTAWLPFNLGTRPESYVAFGVTVVLALLWRARSPAALGVAAVAAGLTVAVSPTGVLVVAPILGFLPRIRRVLVRNNGSRLDQVACIVLISCAGSVALVSMFADQTWTALLTATEWHNFWGPSLPWWEEPQRYRYLFGDDQQGSFAKRLPLLLTAALAAVVVVRRRRGPAGLLALVLVLALALLALSPSKWSYHLGALAGVMAAFLTVAVVSVLNRPAPLSNSVIGGLLVAGAAAWAFHGPNTWWLPAVYALPWPDGPIRPWGVPLDTPLFWIAVLCAAAFSRRTVRAWPAVAAVTAAVVALAVLFGSFGTAPMRRAAGSLALDNVHRVTGGPLCGLADDIEVLPDGPPLRPLGGTATLQGFAALAGYVAPPPDPPGAGASTYLWGSHDVGDVSNLVSPWFSLDPGQGIAASVSGRTDDGNTLTFEFGDSTTVLGTATPVDRVAPNEEPERPLWRTLGVDESDVPTGADRVRIRATDDRSDEFGWLAVTGPRSRTAVPLTRYLADRGPVVVGWPVAFLFPCIRDIPVVSGGVAQTPGALILGPRPRFDEERDQHLGGTFAELDQFGALGEVPTQLAGHPDVEWGALLVSGDKAPKDAYDRVTTRVVRPGWDDTGRVQPEH
jgi:arabinosyltransferase C